MIIIREDFNARIGEKRSYFNGETIKETKKKDTKDTGQTQRTKND